MTNLNPSCLLVMNAWVEYMRSTYGSWEMEIYFQRIYESLYLGMSLEDREHVDMIIDTLYNIESLVILLTGEEPGLYILKGE